MRLTVGELKRVIRMLEEGEPRMSDDSQVRVDFLNAEGIVMGPVSGAKIESVYWSIEEQVLSLMIRTEKRVEL